MSLHYNKERNEYIGFGIYFSVGNWSNIFYETDWGMYEQKRAIEQGYGLGIKY